MIMAKSVEEYISKSEEWEQALRLLRKLLGRNRTDRNGESGVCRFIAWVKSTWWAWEPLKAMLDSGFIKGVFLHDDYNKLINAQEGKTKAMRQWRFESIDEIRDSHSSYP